MSDFEYKQGDVDTVGVQLLENGVPINLTGYTVTLVIKKDSTRNILTCTEGGIVNGESVPFSSGGITVQVTSEATSEVGIYDGEFVVNNARGSVRVPSGNNYKSFQVFRAL
jgi:hypothetical protein